MASESSQHSQTVWLFLRRTKHIHRFRVLLGRQFVPETAPREVIRRAQSKVCDSLDRRSIDLLARKVNHTPRHQAREYTHLRQWPHACQALRLRLVNAHYWRTQNHVLRDCWLCSAWVSLLRALHGESGPVGCGHTDFWTTSWPCPIHRPKRKRNV